MSEGDCPTALPDRAGTDNDAKKSATKSIDLLLSRMLTVVGINGPIKK